MPYSIEFQLAGLLIVGVLTVVFFSKPRWQSLQNSIFRFLLPLTALELIFDIISVITIAEREHIPYAVNTFFTKGYIIAMEIWIAVSVIYIFSNFVIDDSDEKGKKLFKISIYATTIPALCCFIITFLFPLQYVSHGREVFSYGIPSTATYFYSVYSVVISIVGAICNFKKMTLQRKVPLFAFTIMEGSVALIQMNFPSLLLIGFGTSVVILIMYLTMENPDMDLIAKLNDANKRANNLLLNILPYSIAKELKENSSTFTEHYDSVTVAFLDIVDFTKMSSELGAEPLVKILNSLFSEFDMLLDNYRIEKIKTIGDAYMVAAGVPDRYEENCEEMMRFLIAAQNKMTEFNKRNKINLQLRIGMNAGPVVAGIIGKKKFIYDLWGSTVNYASRMESYSLPGRIQVSESVYSELKDDYSFEQREPFEIKGCGTCTCWLLTE